MTRNFIQRYVTPENQNIDKEICKILNFPDIENIEIFKDCIVLMEKYLKPHIDSFRTMLKGIGKFSSSTRSIYKRFKHAGMPIIPSIPVISIMQKSSVLEKFERINVIPIGNDPFIDIKLIPFSIEILDRYKELANHLQAILNGMITNKIICIERNMPVSSPR